MGHLGSLTKKIAVFFVITIVAIVLLLAFFISPVTKWAVEKYSVEYTGRQVTMDKFQLNLFSGSIHISGFKIYEAKSKAVFFQCKDMFAEISVPHLLAKKYDLSEIKIAGPVLTIIQKGNRFNFSDLIDRFNKPDTVAKPVNTAPVKWSVKKVEVDTAIFVYTNTSPFNSVKIQRCNILIPGIAWNNKVYSINTDFAFASGGDVKGKIAFDKNNWVYNLSLQIQQFNIKPFYVYLKDFLKVNSLDGLFSTDLHISGNMHNATAIAASGNFTAADFSIIDNVNDRLFAINKLQIDIDSLNTEKNIYHFSNISLTDPFLKFEMYTNGNNFYRLMTSPVATDTAKAVEYANVFIMMASYIQNIMKDYEVSNYKVDKMLMQGGNIVFEDYTLYEKFKLELDDLYLSSDGLNSNSEKINCSTSAVLNHSGQLKGNMSINPKDYKDFNFDLALKKMSITDFNPYSKYYVATPFENGEIEYTNKTTVEKRILKSENDLLINKIIASKKDKTIKPKFDMPVRLGVSLLKDVNGNLQMNIPVEGSLDDPKFKFGKVIWGVVTNLLMKAATAPFRLLANAFGGKEEDFKAINFNYLQADLDADQQKQIDKLAAIIKGKPELKLELIQVNNKEDEANALAIYKAKKNYLGFTDSLTEDQIKQMNSLLINDSLFGKFLDDHLAPTTSFMSAQEKCVLMAGKLNLSGSVDTIMQKRIDNLSNYLLQKQIPKERFLIHNSGKPQETTAVKIPQIVINIASDEQAGEKGN